MRENIKTNRCQKIVDEEKRNLGIPKGEGPQRRLGGRGKGRESVRELEPPVRRGLLLLRHLHPVALLFA